MRPEAATDAGTPWNSAILAEPLAYTRIRVIRQVAAVYDPKRPQAATENATGATLAVGVDGEVPSDLREVIERWGGLPQCIRQSIVVMVRSASDPLSAPVPENH